MPRQNGGRLHEMERRAPAVPSLREPGPQCPINSGEPEPWAAGTIRNGQLVPKRDDLQVQRRACTNQEPERVE